MANNNHFYICGILPKSQAEEFEEQLKDKFLDDVEVKPFVRLCTMNEAFEKSGDFYDIFEDFYDDHYDSDGNVTNEEGLDEDVVLFIAEGWGLDDAVSSLDYPVYHLSQIEGYDEVEYGYPGDSYMVEIGDSYFSGSAEEGFGFRHLDEMLSELAPNMPELRFKYLSEDELSDETKEEFEIVDGVLVKYNAKSNNVVIPAGVTKIGNGVFNECDFIKSVAIPSGVTEICDDAFYYCESLKSIVIPEGVTKIGSAAFCGCYDLESVTLPSTLKEIGDGAFDCCRSLESVTVPADTIIGKDAFDDAYCEVIRKSIMANEDFETEDGVLKKYKGNGGDVVIPEDVTEIGSNSFSGCTSLTSVVIPEGVTKIGYMAFYECTSLASVTIPASVTEIEGSAFSGCGFAENFKAEAAGWRFENCVAIKDGVVEYFTNKNAEKITIPESVTEINSNALRKCTSLALVTIPQSVTKVGLQAFMQCESLTSVAIPESVKEIGDGAFKACGFAEDFKAEAAGWRFENSLAIKDGVVKYCTNKKAEKIAIPEGVTEIGMDAFFCHESLSSVVIPESVTEIGDGAFSGCKSLKQVTVPASTTIGDGAFPEDCEVVIRKEPSPDETPAEPIPATPARTYKIEISAEDAKKGCKKIVRYNRKAKDGSEQTVRVSVEIPAGTAGKEIVFVSDEGDWNEAAGKNNAVVVVVKVKE